MMIIAFSAYFATRLAPRATTRPSCLGGLGKLRRCREVAPPIGGDGVAPVAVHRGAQIMLSRTQGAAPATLIAKA
jgi:hypothetical protein